MARCQPQAGFGLMVRDDMYVDEYVSTTMGDYVVAGTVFQSTNLLGYNTYARKSGSLTYCGGSLEAAPQAGDTVPLEIASTTDGYLAKYGDNDSVISGYDFALTSVDGDYIYVGFFAARTIEISASNIELTIDGVKMENYDSYAIDDGDDMSARNTLVLTTLSIVSPTSARMFLMLVSDWRVSSATPPSANSPVAGLMGSCPET